MYAICINGAPGSGKTTLSNELLKDEKICIVHIDHILNRLKKVLPKKELLNVYCEDGYIYHDLNKNSLIYKLIHMNYINHLYVSLRYMYVKREIKKLREIAISEGKDYFVIEGINSDYYSDVCPFDYKIFVRADIDDRRFRLEYRDKKPVAETVLMAVPDESVDFNDYDVVINNNSSLEEYNVVVAALGNAIKSNRKSIRRLEIKKN